LQLPAEKSPTSAGYRKLDGPALCRDGWLVVTTQSDYATEGTSHSHKIESKLIKLEDGSLIVFVHKRRSSRLLVFGYSDDMESWYLFRRAK
jgi:hypothetical protein